MSRGVNALLLVAVTRSAVFCDELEELLLDELEELLLDDESDESLLLEELEELLLDDELPLERDLIAPVFDSTFFGCVASSAFALSFSLLASFSGSEVRSALPLSDASSSSFALAAVPSSASCHIGISPSYPSSPSIACVSILSTTPNL
jgi:hypothetical protein